MRLHAPLHHRLETDLSPAEARRLARRIGGMLVAAALLVVGVVHRMWLVPGAPEISALVLAAGALVAAGPVFGAGLRGFVGRDPHATLEQLVSLALLAALAVGEFEVAILVPLLMQIGHFLEERSIRGARAAIEGLKKLKPGQAHVETPEGERDMEAESLAPGAVVVVRPGEMFPADGRVVVGTSAVDQSSMTGESVAEEVGPGALVYAGTMNLSGLVKVRVTGVAEGTALGRIVKLLHEAERSKAPIMKLIERYAVFYLPAVLVVAGVVLVLAGDLDRAIAVLVVSCPCALVVASPAAMTAALAVASRLGVLIKNTRFLEVLGDVNTLILDKTGTVTMGHLEVVEVRPVDGADADEVLAEASCCAYGSRHPVSQAVLMKAGGGNPGGPTPVSIEEVHGRGVVARRNGIVIRLGSHAWLAEEGLAVPAPPEHVGPVVWVARGRQVLGMLLLADRPRPGGREAIERVRRLDVDRTVLITGDRREVAETIGRELGFDEVLAECLPEQKLEVVDRERAGGRRVMMVGDGVNDSLALSRADVGIAMGAMGSEVAVESADVALMSNDLDRLPCMIQLSRRTRTNIHQNVAIAVASSLGLMTLASLGVISPIAGALVHNAGTFLVILNAARLLR